MERSRLIQYGPQVKLNTKGILTLLPPCSKSSDNHLKAVQAAICQEAAEAAGTLAGQGCGLGGIMEKNMEATIVR